MQIVETAGNRIIHHLNMQYRGLATLRYGIDHRRTMVRRGCRASLAEISQKSIDTGLIS